MKTFNILTVCTGNICRSPLAELLLRQHLQDLPVKVRSVGTNAMVGSGMPGEQLAIAHSLGVDDPESHKAVQVTAQVTSGANLIIAMSREHRAYIAQLDPKFMRRTFTLRELSRIIPQLPAEDFAEITAAAVPERLVQAVEVLAFNRGIALPPATPDDDDIIDPYQRPTEVYELSRDQLVAALNTLMTFFRRVIA